MQPWLSTIDRARQRIPVEEDNRTHRNRQRALHHLTERHESSLDSGRHTRQQIGRPLPGFAVSTAPTQAYGRDDDSQLNERCCEFTGIAVGARPRTCPRCSARTGDNRPQTRSVLS